MNCHGETEGVASAGGSIALVGNSNVGKSVVFHRLTGRYVNVSNYPGTTVEIARGSAPFLPESVVIDTPGLLMLPANSEDERITADLLLRDPFRAVVQVGDAKNLRRTLLLTLQLAEMELPLVLALNMMDEAEAHGLHLQTETLSQALGIPVIPTVAVQRRGIDRLEQAIAEARASRYRLTYPAEVEAELAPLAEGMPDSPISARALALLWLAGDQAAGDWLGQRMEASVLDGLAARRDRLAMALGESPADVIQRARWAAVNQIAEATIQETEATRSLGQRLGDLATHRVWGPAILGVVVFGLYEFVGVFGAQTLVRWMEAGLFGKVVNPWLTDWLTRWIPIPLVVDALVGPYGLWTMGLTYALALILPIVSTFFLAFGLMEDSGYLPRLAVLSHRLFRIMGLNGKAVLPMVLGLGCVTTATLTTRILETRRERLLAVLLLALAIPCSAQLGVVMGMLGAVSFQATLVWLAVVAAVLICVGWLAARLVPGERSSLMLELPPLRLPVAANVLVKTAARLEWYLKEVVPLFLLGSLLVFVLDQTGLLSRMARLTEPLVTGWLGLPAEASLAFLLGFLRRDFGATGLFALQSRGLLSASQTLVAMVTITLFIPCIAAVMMIARQHGWRTTAAIVAVVFPLAFLVGGLLRILLQATGWT
ncbi:MAG: ferrous iron transport protein B [Elusimicrobia bacterium RBG_16_66_12]|nr:MAG: ferrous iron transport protein B [Elusimicrobia bacterium RBG_16_66_12]